MLANLSKHNKEFNVIFQQEQFNQLPENQLYKIKLNLLMKNSEKNKFLFIVNLLLLERATGQRVVFIKETVDSPRIKPIKVGCSVILRSENMQNFWKIFVYNSLPKLYELVLAKNKNLGKQHLLYFNINKFLFLAVFSYFIDFDKFLTYYEDMSYYISSEFYTSFHKFLPNRITFSLNGLNSF